MIWIIITLNIVVLASVFLIPRAKVMDHYWGWESTALMETSGAMDTPNQYSETYKVANQIRKITSKDSIIFMPKDDWEFGSNRSVVIQRLYPRKVYFFGDEWFKDTLIYSGNVEKEIFVVFNSDWGKPFCKGKQIESLNNPEFGFCRIEKGSLN